MSEKNVAAAVLAAGASLRMGKSKQDIEIEGQTLLSRTIKVVAASKADFVVVTLDRTRSGLFESTKAEIVRVENPQLGISESIRAALGAIEKRGYDAVLFTPCDLPLLSVEHLNALISLFQSGDWQIVASRYEGVLGTPLIVRADLWNELKALQGDTGARKLIPPYRDETAFVDWKEGKFDLDIPADVERFQSRRQTESKSTEMPALP